MKVTINLNFSNEEVNNKKDLSVLFDKKIKEELKKHKVVPTKIRTSYVESKYGLADYPPTLFLIALLTLDSGFSWKIPEYNGKFVLNFKE